jgi:hypothetical protein
MFFFFRNQGGRQHFKATYYIMNMLQVTTSQYGVAKAIDNMFYVVKERIQDQSINVKHMRMTYMF